MAAERETNRMMQADRNLQNNPTVKPEDGRKAPPVRTFAPDQEQRFDTSYRAVVEIALGAEPSLSTSVADMVTKLGTEDAKAAINTMIDNYKAWELNWSGNKWKKQLEQEKTVREGEAKQIQAAKVIADVTKSYCTKEE